MSALTVPRQAFITPEMLQITCYHGTDPSVVQQEKKNKKTHPNPICIRGTTPTDESQLQKIIRCLKPPTLALVCGGAMFLAQA